MNSGYFADSPKSMGVISSRSSPKMRGGADAVAVDVVIQERSERELLVVVALLSKFEQAVQHHAGITHRAFRADELAALR